MGMSLELEIVGLAHDGRGIAARKPGELVTFVAGALPGERVQAELCAEKKGFREARCVCVIQPAEDAVEPSCVHAEECGGCPLMRMPYASQLSHKADIVANALRRIGHLQDLPLAAIRPSPATLDFRNKTELAFTTDDEGTVRLGMRRRAAHAIVPTPNCRLMEPSARAVIPVVEACATELGLSVQAQAPDEELATQERRRGRQGRNARFGKSNLPRAKEPQGLLRFCEFRTGLVPDLPNVPAGQSGRQAVWLRLVTSRANAKEKDALRMLASRILDLCPDVETIICEEKTGTDLFRGGAKRSLVLGRQAESPEGALMALDLAGRRYLCDAADFFQVNLGAAAYLAQEASAGLAEGDLLDLYCGCGAPGLSCVRDGAISGIEYSESSVQTARRNAARFGVKARYQAGDAARLLAKAIKDRPVAQVLADPPRAGLAPEVAKGLLAAAPERMAFISCNPATLARDLAFFAERYAITQVVPVDLFPHSPHVETVCLLSRCL